MSRNPGDQHSSLTKQTNKTNKDRKQKICENEAKLWHKDFKFAEISQHKTRGCQSSNEYICGGVAFGMKQLDGGLERMSWAWALVPAQKIPRCRSL